MSQAAPRRRRCEPQSRDTHFGSGLRAPVSNWRQPAFLRCARRWLECVRAVPAFDVALARASERRQAKFANDPDIGVNIITSMTPVVWHRSGAWPSIVHLRVRTIDVGSPTLESSITGTHFQLHRLTALCLDPPRAPRYGATSSCPSLPFAQCFPLVKQHFQCSSHGHRKPRILSDKFNTPVS